MYRICLTAPVVEVEPENECRHNFLIKVPGDYLSEDMTVYAVPRTDVRGTVFFSLSGDII